jgi:exonuclease VII small subunit
MVQEELAAEDLQRDARDLERRRDTEPDLDVRTELTRSLESVREQIDIARRLDRSLTQIVARIESGALGLERLVAQLAEILALSEAGEPDRGAAGLDQLADELEGLRAGLAETEQLSRRALSASGREGTVEHPGAQPGETEG